jgi:hypothetical protein
MAGAMASGTAVIPDDATCISLCLPGSNESPTLACQGCIDFADVLTLRPTAKRNKKNECKYPFEDKFRTDKEGAKRDTWAKINAYLLRPAANDVSSTQQNDEANDDESDAALNNDTLPDDVGDPQKQAPLCRQVSPDPARVIRDAVQQLRCARHHHQRRSETTRGVCIKRKLVMWLSKGFLTIIPSSGYRRWVVFIAIPNNLPN